MTARWLALIGIAFLLAACGRSGPLELPPEELARRRFEQKPKQAEEQPTKPFVLDRLL